MLEVRSFLCCGARLFSEKNSAPALKVANSLENTMVFEDNKNIQKRLAWFCGSDNLNAVPATGTAKQTIDSRCGWDRI